MDNDEQDTRSGRVRHALRAFGSRVRERWHRHGKPLVAATADAVRGAADMPREALERERIVRVGEAHLKRLVAGWVAGSRKVSDSRLDLENGFVHLRVTLRRWRPVHADARFRLVLGPADDENIAIGIVRTRPTQFTSNNVLMRLFIKLYVLYARWRGDEDPLDRILARRKGSWREGDVVFVPVPRAVLTERVGNSRVLRRVAAYAEISSLTVKPGELEVGFHLGKLAERISDLYALRHLIGNVIVAGVGEDAQGD